MKKSVLVVFLAVFSLLICLSVAADDEVRDNSLQIESNRLEEEEKTDQVKLPSQLSKDLFSAKDKKVLEQKKSSRLKAFKKQEKKLFQGKSSKERDSKIKPLFSSTWVSSQYDRRVLNDEEAESQGDSSGSLLLVFYGLASLLLIAGAGFATYRIDKGEDGDSY